MAKRNAALARQPAASATPEKISHDEGIAPQPSAGGAMEPPKKRNGPRLSM